MRMGGVFCGLIQPSAPPKRDLIRGACPARCLYTHRMLPTTNRYLQEGTPVLSKTREPIHALPKVNCRGMLEQATRRTKNDSSTFINQKNLKDNEGAITIAKVSDLVLKQRNSPRSRTVISKKYAINRSVINHITSNSKLTNYAVVSIKITQKDIGQRIA